MAVVAGAEASAAFEEEAFECAFEMKDAARKWRCATRERWTAVQGRRR